MEQQELADWISDLNDLYLSASMAEIAERVQGFRDSGAHELAEKIRQEARSADIPGSPASPNFVRGMLYAADLIDPQVD